MRGEHNAIITAISHENGSSPHAWGTQIQMVQQRIEMRFIPTCVGNTSILVEFSSGDTVHPHMRGEHANDVRERGEPSGSSPHAWGTRRKV